MIAAPIVIGFSDGGHGEVLRVESGCRGVQVELKVELDPHDATAKLRAELNGRSHGVKEEMKGLVGTMGMKETTGMRDTMGTTSNRLDRREERSNWHHTPVLFEWLWSVIGR
jgi:hypothetical protein